MKLTDALTNLADQLGYSIRYEWLGGGGGGMCQYRGKTWLFLDLDAEPADRLEMLVAALAGDERWKELQLDAELRDVLQSRAVAKAWKA